MSHSDDQQPTSDRDPDCTPVNKLRLDDHLIQPDERPTRSDALRNRARLIDTAAALFEQHGVDAVTMSEVAQAAGVGKGTLYRHFSNKTDLCQAMLDQDQRGLQARTLDRLRDPLYAPCDNLHWFLEEVARFVARNIDLLTVIGDATAPPTLDHPAHQWWRQTARGLLTRMDTPGDIDYLADVLYAMVDAYTLRYQLITRRYDLQRVLDGLHVAIDRLTA